VAKKWSDEVKYYAITIGPIYDAVSLTSSPSGMWTASYMFSKLAYLLCKEIEKLGLSILSPCYEEPEDAMRHGTGLFPDHIIFWGDEVKQNELKVIFNKTKKDLATLLEPDKEKLPALEKYLDEFLQINVLAFDCAPGMNAIAASSVLLAGLELRKTFPVPDTQLLLKLFENYGRGENESRNNAVKNTRLVQDCGADWPLWLDDKLEKVKDIETIAKLSVASDAKQMKKSSYYAIVQADGDKMGATITSLSTMEDIQAFSMACWKYSIEAADLIRKFGGMPIYAGGDDLLFIAPVEYEGVNIIQLLHGIAKVFCNAFSNYPSKPTLSFGVAISYYKHPLYESFETAHSLLMREAKQVDGKNALVLRLEKHSGQTVKFVLKGFSKQFEENTVGKALEDLLNSHCDDAALDSIQFHLLKFQPLFDLALKNGCLGNAFENMFDSEIHASGENEAYIESVRRLTEILDLDWPYHNREELLEMVDCYLRYAKFFAETGTEEG
jgi:CRISPR-associated protein Cmr2